MKPLFVMLYRSHLAHKGPYKSIVYTDTRGKYVVIPYLPRMHSCPNLSTSRLLCYRGNFVNALGSIL